MRTLALPLLTLLLHIGVSLSPALSAFQTALVLQRCPSAAPKQIGGPREADTDRCKTMMPHPLFNLASPVVAPLLGGLTHTNICIQLEDRDLWQKFHRYGNEMIVNKAGRNIFPFLRYKVTGLEPHAMYNMFVRLDPMDDCKYKFQRGGWAPTGRADPLPLEHSDNGRPLPYAHPHSPAPGLFWMDKEIEFGAIKITNDESDPKGNILVNSMQKYVPSLCIVRLPEVLGRVPQTVAMGKFPETEFVAVTAYQNREIAQLKIEHNKYAKGLREKSAHHRDLSVSTASANDNDDANVPPRQSISRSVAIPVPQLDESEGREEGTARRQKRKISGEEEGHSAKKRTDTPERQERARMKRKGVRKSSVDSGFVSCSTEPSPSPGAAGNGTQDIGPNSFFSGLLGAPATPSAPLPSCSGAAAEVQEPFLSMDMDSSAVWALVQTRVRPAYIAQLERIWVNTAAQLPIGGL